MEIKPEVAKKFLSELLSIEDEDKWLNLFGFFLKKNKIQKPYLILAMKDVLKKQPSLLKNDLDYFRLLTRIPTADFRKMFLDKVPLDLRKKLPEVTTTFGPQGEGITMKANLEKKYPNLARVLAAKDEFYSPDVEFEVDGDVVLDWSEKFLPKGADEVSIVTRKLALKWTYELEERDWGVKNFMIVVPNQEIEVELSYHHPEDIAKYDEAEKKRKEKKEPGYEKSDYYDFDERTETIKVQIKDVEVEINGKTDLGGSIQIAPSNISLASVDGKARINFALI